MVGDNGFNGFVLAGGNGERRKKNRGRRKGAIEEAGEATAGWLMPVGKGLHRKSVM